ncbi:MAG: acetyl-CoA carboxylase biotin carboxyl carrier protein subunit [Bdellovibrionales bacterium]|nr:acetyl-CoA carboxylase biotin carboxyl carrier protein subunit [Bdellovibrionales bacterium]
MLFEAELKKKKYQVIVTKTAHTWEVTLTPENGDPEKFSIPHKDFQEADNVISFLFQDNSYLIDAVPDGINYQVYTRGSYRTVKIFNDEMLLHESLKSGKSLGKETGLTAGMPGKIVNVMVTEGQEVKEGDSILIMEAMKMENDMKAPQDAKIKKIRVNTGDNVESGAILVEFE